MKRVAIFPLPHVDSTFAQARPGGEAIADHQGAVAHILSLMRQKMTPGRRNVLVGHAFAFGGSESESERPLSVGGAGRVSAGTFEGFDFVALSERLDDVEHTPRFRTPRPYADAVGCNRPRTPEGTDRCGAQ